MTAILLASIAIPLSLLVLLWVEGAMRQREAAKEGSTWNNSTREEQST